MKLSVQSFQLITMRGFIVDVFFSFLFISASASDGHGQVVRVHDSPITCSSDGVVCEFNEDNLLGSVPHVPTLEDCRQICLAVENCQYISYFDENAIPFSNFCQLFKTCETVNNCSNCFTENIDCRTCGANVVGALNENVQDIIPYIESEIECKILCLTKSTCSFYTYFFSNDTLYHKYCVLQTEFVLPAQPCTTCVSGPVDCSNSGGCSLNLEEESYQSLMLNNTNKTYNIIVTGRECKLRFLVVGGGGNSNSYHGGGGSGKLSKYKIYGIFHTRPFSLQFWTN